MKKLNVLLSALAFVFAIAGAFASKLNNEAGYLSKTAYTKNTSAQTCNSITVDDNCTTSGGNACVVGSNIFRDATWSCGPELFKP